MGDQLYPERFVWFDHEARKERYPNAFKLGDHFEISVKTAQRSIDHFRDRLLAPLNEPKAGRSILNLIARQTTPEKMSALYFKYKESGLTVGELRKIAPKPKLSGAPVDLTFVDQFYDRIYLLDSATLTNDQKMSLNLTIVKMRSMLLEKTHKLKVPVTVTA